MLDNFKQQLVLFKSFSVLLKASDYRQRFVDMFVSMINFWVVSVRFSSRTSKDRSWLLIYDNVSDFSLLKEYFPPDTARGSVMVTTRFFSRLARVPGHMTPIELSKFDPDMSLRFFNSIRTARDPTCDIDKEVEETREVLETIDGLALGIKQMAYYITKKRFTISMFQEKYSTTARYILTCNPPEDTDSLASLWSLQFQDIKDTNSFKLLGMLALAHAEDIPRDLFELDEPLEGDSIADWTSFCEDPGELEEAIDTLTDNALIDDDGETGKLSIHRLTQEAFIYQKAIYGLVDSSSLQTAFDALLGLLVLKFPHAQAHEGLWSRWAECSKYLPHVAALARAYKRFQKKKSATERIQPSLAFVTLMVNATWYLQEIGELQECLDMLEIATSACVDKNSFEYAYLCNTYVTVAVDQNDMEMGQNYSKKAIAIREAKLSPSNMELASSYANYANCLNNEGKYDEAIPHLVAAEHIWATEVGQDKIYTALAQLNLGRSFALKGSVATATDYFQSAQKLFTEKSHTMFLIGVHYTWGAMLLRNGHTLEALGKLKLAYDAAKDFMPYKMTLSGIHYKLGVAQLELDLIKEAK
ncbi:hypothetical protein B0T25DRAFT_460837 [Lasiosphaeria hispida]|uniref:DUF7779 domain-containing protein n=1 Tax=Lasiosphaeria hispida TaxID=260671 RepID=A0AAJ0HAT6_9PEZI|nr:hypothetical protein B0T25DRAFT_460837 [Lasiosphaeria hispida]